MANFIIYPSPDRQGGICLVTPSGSMSIEDVANRDLPAGAPYLFVNQEDVPTDHRFFEAWEADFTNPDGYALGYDEWSALNPDYVFNNP